MFRPPPLSCYTPSIARSAVGPPPSTAAGFSEIGAGDEAAGERRKLSDVRTWVSCRALLDSVSVGELRVVNFPVPRGEGGVAKAEGRRVKKEIREMRWAER